MTRKHCNRHPAEFKEQALAKARTRGKRSLEAVAQELNLPVGTLKGWLKTGPQSDASRLDASLPTDGSASPWSATQRLQALMESYALDGEDLHAWCREHGVFEHQLKQWRQDFCNNPPGRDARDGKAELRQLQGQHEQLQRELRRKEKALAEAAALLVLQKKFQALWGDEAK